MARLRSWLYALFPVLALVFYWLVSGCGCPSGMVRTAYPGISPTGAALPRGRCVVPE